MIWLLLAVVVVGVPVLTLLADLNHRDLARTSAIAEAALRRVNEEPRKRRGPVGSRPPTG